jgi:hypothetical protein
MAKVTSGPASEMGRTVSVMLAGPDGAAKLSPNVGLAERLRAAADAVEAMEAAAAEARPPAATAEQMAAGGFR